MDSMNTDKDLQKCWQDNDHVIESLDCHFVFLVPCLLDKQIRS